MTRLYYDLNDKSGKIRGLLALSDERALDLLLHGFTLKPAGWKLDDMVKS